MKKILVDTSIIIEFLRLTDKTKSVFYQIFNQTDYLPVVSLVTVSELWAGKSMKNEATLTVVEELLTSVEILPSNLKIAKKTGEILRLLDYTIAFQDAMLAASALEKNLAVLTFNEKDFIKIPGLSLFKQ